MKREEAIKMLEYLATDTTGELASKDGKYAEFLVKVIDALDMGIAALMEQEHFREVTKMTNADYVRSMSDEELARFSNFCPTVEGECPIPKGGCYECILNWLRQPYTE